MNLFIDLDSLNLITAANDRRLVNVITAKRGDALPMTVMFIRSGSPVRLDASTEITFAIKESGKYDDQPLVLQAGFTASAVGDPDSNPSYSATPSLNTEGLNDLFLIDNDESNDPSFIDLMAEITWEADGDDGPTTIKTFFVRMENDVYRGNETTPLGLPTPIDWLDDQNTLRGIQPIRSGVNLFPTSLEVNGALEQIIIDAGEPAPIPSLDFVQIDENGFPEFEADLAQGGTLTLVRAGSDWALEYDKTPVNELLELTSAVTDPTGLVFTSGSDTTTLTATDGKLSPKLGDQGRTNDGTWYRWDGTEWIPDFSEAISYSGNNPNIPENLTITGITTPAASDPLTLPRISDSEGFPRWELNSGEWSVSHSMGTWGVLGDGGAEYQALKASTALTPLGLTAWTVSEGAGQPTISGDNPSGDYLGQLLQAADGTWWRWAGSEWEQDLTVQTYIGPVVLASAATIAWDVDADGRVAKIDTLDHNATVNLSGLGDGEEAVIYVTQDATGGRSLTVAQSGLTVRGATTAIADLTAGQFAVVTLGRSGYNLFVNVNTSMNA
jgi:hypothetical protein